MPFKRIFYSFVILCSSISIYGQNISTYAGTGVSGFSGDGGQARSAQLNNPAGLATDALGNLFIADASNFRIRKVTPGGIISTYAGNGLTGTSGDGGQALAARFNSIEGLLWSVADELLVVDKFGNNLRKIAANGIITRVAGNGTAGFSGDGGAATAANLNQPYALAQDAAGNLYISDRSNHRIRKVSTSGIITTFCGTGTATFSGDGGLAINASLNAPTGLTFDAAGNLLIADWGNRRIRSINPAGIITTIAGDGTSTIAGNGISPLATGLGSPFDVKTDKDGHIYISATDRLFEIDDEGKIYCIAGNGGILNNGDNVLVPTSVSCPASYLSVNKDSSIFITEGNFQRVRKLGKPMPPQLTGIGPSTAKTGQSVGLQGSQLTGIKAISFGGTPAASFAYTSGWLAVVGPGSSGNVTVVTRGGTTSLAGFIYLPPPIINSFSPVNGVAGASIKIFGQNFTSTTAVKFGNTNASSYTVTSATEISAVVGNGSSGDVSITNVNGTGSLDGFAFTSLTGFSPLSGGEGNTITITGTNLQFATAVSFGGVPAASFTIVSPTTITAVLAAVGASGTVAVVTPGGTATRGGFTYNYPVPAVSSFTPTSAANRSTVRITGNNLSRVSVVRFGGVLAYSFTIIDNNTIDAVVGPGASGSVSVSSLGGTANLAGFTYIPTPPTIDNLLPAAACSTNATITIRGLNFTGTTSVEIGGNSVAFTLLSDTTISFVAVAGTKSGFVKVTTPIGSATTTSIFFVSTGVPSFQVVPSPLQLCAGNARKVFTNLPGRHQYSLNNAVPAPAVNVQAPGNYILTATDEYGCSNSTAFTVSNLADCSGFLELECDPVFNYFDTLNVTVRIRGGVNIFSAFAYLNFNTTHLKYVSSAPGNFLGPNVLIQGPVITGGQIDFGMSRITGAPGVNGDGIIYTFRFVLANQIPDLASFDPVKPNSFPTSLSLTNLSVYNVQGLLPPSFASLSVLSQQVACRYYVPIWPGDLDFDRRVTVSDILPIGYFYGIAGPARPGGNLSWTAQPSQLWGFDKTNKNSSAYRTFADGTPDGIINLADQTSIGFNLNRVRLTKNTVSPNIVTNNFDPALPPVTVSIPSTQIPLAAMPVNETVTISLGSVSKPANNIYGVAFDLLFNTNNVNTNAIVTSYANSIFGTEGVQFTKIEDRTSLATGRLSIGITRFNTNGITANGGEVVKITLPLIAGGGSGLLKITAIPLAANDPTGVAIALTGSADSLQIGTAAPCTTNTWAGTVSNAWENEANWSCGTVPVSTTEVAIPAGTPFAPVIKSMATCKSLTSATGSNVKIDPGYKLIIVGPQ